jgi:hypothetical protein
MAMQMASVLFGKFEEAFQGQVVLGQGQVIPPDKEA